jgi:hypothetical protein
MLSTPINLAYSLASLPVVIELAIVMAEDSDDIRAWISGSKSKLFNMGINYRDC